MAKKSKNHEEELKEAQIKLKELGKIVREKNKQLKMLEKGEISNEEIKPFFEGK